MTKYNERVNEQFKLLYKKMEDREAFYIELERYYTKHGNVPVKYQFDWDIWINVEKRQSFKTMPAVIKRLKKAAKKAVRNA